MAFNEKTPVIPVAPPPDLGGGVTKDPTKWAATGSAIFDTTGMNIPGYPTSATGEQIANAIQALAYSNKDHGQVVGPIRQLLQNYAGNYTKNEKHLIWTSKDNLTLKDYLGQLHANNLINPTTPLSLAAWNSRIQSNPNYGVTNSVTTKPAAPIVVPAQADLTNAAQTAFASVLGRSASPKEAADFAQKYQTLIESYGTAKQDVKKGNEFDAPANPIKFAQMGQNPSNTILPSTPDTNTAIQAPPNATVAASNFAARQNPTAASAQAASDGLNQFMSMLKGQ